MKVGVMQSSMATGEPVRFRDTKRMAQAAEAAGLDSFWLADHLIYRFPEKAESGIWEVFSLLGGVAAATERIQIGPLVACTSFRNPALTAKIADTLDEMSEGRFILGLGAGWHEPEYTAYGYPFDHRAGRFEEAMGVIVPLLREGRVNFHGKYYEATDCALLPRGPSPKGPPIWVGAKGPRMLKLIAQHADAYNTVWHLDPAVALERWEIMKAACVEVGRDVNTLAFTAGTFAHVLAPGESPAEGEAEKRIVGTAAEVAARLRGFADVGVTHLVVIPESNAPESVARLGDAVAML